MRRERDRDRVEGSQGDLVPRCIPKDGKGIAGRFFFRFVMLQLDPSTRLLQLASTEQLPPTEVTCLTSSSSALGAHPWPTWVQHTTRLLQQWVFSLIIYKSHPSTPSNKTKKTHYFTPPGVATGDLAPLPESMDSKFWTPLPSTPTEASSWKASWLVWQGLAKLRTSMLPSLRPSRQSSRCLH